METMAQKLRSGKFLQECSKKFLTKDGSKRMADPLPDSGGKKRILGDITNKNALQMATLKKEKITRSTSSQIEEPPSKHMAKPVPLESDSLLYVTALEDSVLMDVSITREKASGDKESTVEMRPEIPVGVKDFDKSCGRDPLSVTDYAQDIFQYYREREKRFLVSKYLGWQPEISRTMRAILVDWMVEVQESFELNHETLYLAVKLVDRFLMVNEKVPKAKLQLVGATAVFVAAKFDERLPPLVDDFLYICDDSYTREELLKTEVKMLKRVDFDLGIPLSYRFLRRYSRCAGISMDLLTLARYILETALMDYDLIDVADSKIAAAALLLALKMKKQNWTPTLQHYSGYEESELRQLLFQLNKNISGSPSKHVQTIRTKYSHQIFFQVSKVPPLNFQQVVVTRKKCQSVP